MGCHEWEVADTFQKDHSPKLREKILNFEDKDFNCQCQHTKRLLAKLVFLLEFLLTNVQLIFETISRFSFMKYLLILFSLSSL